MIYLKPPNQNFVSMVYKSHLCFTIFMEMEQPMNTMVKLLQSWTKYLEPGKEITQKLTGAENLLCDNWLCNF